MLFGGRPLPKLPLWVRLLIALAVLTAFLPTIKSVAEVLPLPFVKMTAKQTERALATTHPLWGNPSGPERDVRCEKGTDNWDYVCTLVVYPAKSSQKRVKVGVRVGYESLKQVSPPHDLDTRYIKQ